MWKGGNIHLWILVASNWAIGKADEAFNLLKVCALVCLTNKVSATHNSIVQINDRIDLFGVIIFLQLSMLHPSYRRICGGECDS
jgi:hypothetical protein